MLSIDDHLLKNNIPTFFSVKQNMRNMQNDILGKEQLIHKLQQEVALWQSRYDLAQASIIATEELKKKIKELGLEKQFKDLIS